MNSNLTIDPKSDPAPMGVYVRDYLHKVRHTGQRDSRRLLIAGIMAVALLAFEIFNFDTTRYALANLLGNVQFMSVGWATILAIAFCSIDLAGLMRIFTPDNAGEPSREAWYLMGAWLLGATMNAIMTWWAVSLTLLNHDFGNEVLDRDTLLLVVPIFVAVLVWLTRILFIGALTMTGEHLVASYRGRQADPDDGRLIAAPLRVVNAPQPQRAAAQQRAAAPQPVREAVTLRERPSAPRPPATAAAAPVAQATTAQTVPAAQPPLIQEPPARDNSQRTPRVGGPLRPQPNARARTNSGLREKPGGDLQARSAPNGD